MTVVSLHVNMANNLFKMFYACHCHDHAKASVMHAQAVLSLAAFRPLTEQFLVRLATESC